jgi:hypothetical protein
MQARMVLSYGSTERISSIRRALAKPNEGPFACSAELLSCGARKIGVCKSMSLLLPSSPLGVSVSLMAVL